MTDLDIFDRLMAQIHRRAAELPEGSYTTKLIRGGPSKMGAKVLEEVLETTLAAEALANDSTAAEKRSHLVYEAGDVLYHLWVLLGAYGITVQELRQELERREGTSGLEEKKRRQEGEKS